MTVRGHVVDRPHLRRTRRPADRRDQRRRRLDPSRAPRRRHPGAGTAASSSASTPRAYSRASPAAEARCAPRTNRATTACSPSTRDAAIEHEADSRRRLRGRRPVAAGGDRSARRSDAISGVLGLGLPDLNELGWRWRDAVDLPDATAPRTSRPSAPRAIAAKVAPLPLAAIHSTHDEFVPLADVQRVLAAAREPKRLWVVEAADHRFSDNLAELDRRLVEALAWIATARTPRRRDAAPARRARVTRVRHALPAWSACSSSRRAGGPAPRAACGRAGTICTAPCFATPPAAAALALALTALNYVVLTGYDLLAFASIGRSAARAADRGRRLRRLRHRQQRRLRDALRRLGALPLLHALGRHRRGAVADRLQLLGHVLAGPAGARRRSAWCWPAAERAVAAGAGA